MFFQSHISFNGGHTDISELTERNTRKLSCLPKELAV